MAWQCRIVALCHRAPYCTPYRLAGRRVACLQRRIVALPAPCRACLEIQPGGPAARCIATHKAAPSHNTTLYHDSPLARPCVRARCRMPRVQADRIMALPRRVVGVACLYRGHALAAPRPVSLALCHDTIHCIVTQMGNSSSSCLLSIFFSFFFLFQIIFFFSHSSYWKTTKFFFHFPVEPNKIIKIYFILFYFSSFTHSKTSKKIYAHSLSIQSHNSYNP